MQQDSTIPILNCRGPGDEKSLPDDYSELRWLNLTEWLEAVLNDIGLQADRGDSDGWRKTAAEIKTLCYYAYSFDLNVNWSSSGDDWRPIIKLTILHHGGGVSRLEFKGPHRYVPRLSD